MEKKSEEYSNNIIFQMSTFETNIILKTKLFTKSFSSSLI